MEQVKEWIVAGFESRQEAERAADHLLELGFDGDDLVVAVRDHDYASAGGVMVRSEEQDPVAHLAHLIGLAGVPEVEAIPRASKLDSADAVVAVDVEGRYDEVRRVLSDYGGEFDWQDAAERPDWNAARDVLRGHWEQREGSHAERWEHAQAGYHYVYEKAIDPEFRGRTWQSAEPKLQSGYEGWAAAHGYHDSTNAWQWIRETVKDIWSPATRGASPDDIVHSERLHRWVRLTRTTPEGEEQTG